MKTLIVEDDATCRLLLEGYLKAHSEIHHAPDGRSAVIMVKMALKFARPYDLICLDINIPELNGHHALVQIRQMEADAGLESKRRAKIIMTSGLGDRANVAEAVQQRCDYYLVKPFSQITLLRKLQEWRLIFAPEAPEDPASED